MHIISNTALLSINETLIIQIISFLVFMFIMNKIMFKPLKESIAERDGYIETLKKEIDNSQKTISDITERLKKKEKEITAAALQKNKKSAENAYRESSQILQKAQKDILDMKQEVTNEIYSKLDACKKDIEQESKKIAMLIIGRLLSRKSMS